MFPLTSAVRAQKFTVRAHQKFKLSNLFVCASKKIEKIFVHIHNFFSVGYTAYRKY